MANYVKELSYPIRDINTKILGNILLDKPDRSRDFEMFNYYFYLVNGYTPQKKQGIIARSFNYTKSKIKENWFTRLIKWIRR